MNIFYLQNKHTHTHEQSTALPHNIDEGKKILLNLRKIKLSESITL